MPENKRGFASMDPDKQREIASKGGKAAHQSGRAHEFGSKEAAEAGRKGGEAVSENRQHMAEIGRKGGEAVSGNREHMAKIGRKAVERANRMPPRPAGATGPIPNSSDSRRPSRKPPALPPQRQGSIHVPTIPVA
jgi:general stress protein YciG